MTATTADRDAFTTATAAAMLADPAHRYTEISHRDICPGDVITFTTYVRHNNWHHYARVTAVATSRSRYTNEGPAVDITPVAAHAITDGKRYALPFTDTVFVMPYDTRSARLTRVYIPRVIGRGPVMTPASPWIVCEDILCGGQCSGSLCDCDCHAPTPAPAADGIPPVTPWGATPQCAHHNQDEVTGYVVCISHLTADSLTFEDIAHVEGATNYAAALDIVGPLRRAILTGERPGSYALIHHVYSGTHRHA